MNLLLGPFVGRWKDGPKSRAFGDVIYVRLHTLPLVMNKAKVESGLKTVPAFVVADLSRLLIWLIP